MDDEHGLGWQLAVDCRITRRKYYHLIVGPDGEVHFRSKLVGDALEWLRTNSIDSFTVVSDSGEYEVRISPTL